jgi:predicted small metal-binding protein
MTMKAFACGDVVPGCQARWVCSNEDELLARVASHAKDAHGISKVSDELVSQVQARIVTTV